MPHAPEPNVAAVPLPVPCPRCGEATTLVDLFCADCGTPLHDKAAETLVPVDSANFAAIGYRKDTATLYLQFRNDEIHAYFGVHETVHREFETAPSKGVFFDLVLKNRYEHARVR